MGILLSPCLAAVGGSLFAFALLPRPAAAQVFADFQTNMGGFSIELFHEDVPRTVANFVSLAEGTRPWLDPRTQQVRIGVPYYDGIIFHRVIPNFMIQGGSPQGTGTDGPGYKFPDELTKTPEGQLKLTHNAAGMMSMAHSGAKTHTNGSQFFITTSVTAPATFPTHLDDVHSVFGKVTAGPGGTAVQGQAVVDAIAAVPRDGGDRPLTPVVMQSVRIRRVGASAEAFNAQAWSLPDVSEPRRILSAGYDPGDPEVPPPYPGAPPPFPPRLELSYERPQHQASVFNYSFDVATWRLLQVGGSQATPIAAADGTEPLNISVFQNLPELFVRGHSIDYTDLIAKTKPPLSEAAEVRLRFTTPAGMEITVRRTGATTGTWSVAGPPAATGGISPCTYGFGSGDPGFFSPLLDLTFPVDRLPWTGGGTLASLRVRMTFDAGSTTTGYFTASDVNTAPPAPDIGKGVFTVIVR